MLDIISRIEPLTEGAEFLGWKFSADGKWDEGQLAYFADSSNTLSVEPVINWFESKITSNIAFQAMFKSEKNEEFFVGVRMTHLPQEQKLQVIRNLLQSANKEDAVKAVVKKIRDCLQDQKIAAYAPDYLEVGVIAIWNRVKGAVVWRTSEALLPPSKLSERAQTPDTGYAAVYEPQPNPLMLEAAWKAKPGEGCAFQCWIGLPITEFGKVPERHTLSERRYFATAKAFMGT